MSNPFEESEARYSEMPAGEEKEKFGALIERLKEQYAALEATYPDPPPPPVYHSDTERRLALLRRHLEIPLNTPADIANIEAVIKAYESGVLDLDKKTTVNQYAIFFGGRMMRTWGPLDEFFEKGPPAWKEENPAGELFVEDGALTEHYQYAQF